MALAAPVPVYDATLAVDSGCRLGEGILWCEREQVLWWTDIQSSRLWRHKPQTGETRQWTLPDRLGSFALCESGRLLLGLAKGLHTVDPREFEYVDAVSPTLLMSVDADKATLRINDGRVDRSGRFVFGTLNEEPRREPIGSFYQYSHRHGLRRLDLGGVAIPNSLCFDLDGRGLYYCDSLSGWIMYASYDSDTARVGNSVVFAHVDSPASPDGATVDRKGRVWSAHWGAGRAVCYARDGRVERVVSVPTSNVSCVSFGGPAFDQLYITTARDELGDAQMRAQPHAGGVYSAPLRGVSGLPEARFDDR